MDTMRFGFLFKFNDGSEGRTLYSLENNCRLVHAFNDPNVLEVDVYHAVQHGPAKGRVVRQTINFGLRQVSTNGVVHRLIIDI